MQDKILEMEDRSRRNNTSRWSNWRKRRDCEDCEREVLEILRNKLEIEDVTIERVHRVKLYQNKKNCQGESSPRTVVCPRTMLNYKDKIRILRKFNPLKGTSLLHQ